VCRKTLMTGDADRGGERTEKIPPFPKEKKVMTFTKKKRKHHFFVDLLWKGNPGGEGKKRSPEPDSAGRKATITGLV